jgi:hypothetical protein
MEKRFVQHLIWTPEGVHVCISDRNRKMYRIENVNEHSVQLYFGRDYEYWSRRNARRNGFDFSCPISEKDIQDFVKDSLAYSYACPVG